MALRNLVIILGDQLDPDLSALDGFDPARDRVWMAEVAQESTHVWSHKARIALFLSAMRHHAESLRSRGYPLDYLALETHAHSSLGDALTASIAELKPQTLILTLPGDHRVLTQLREVAAHHDLPLDLRVDRHFISTPEEFAQWARGRKQLTMEYFYRALRKRTGILMQDEAPLGGQWNYDAENRHSFGAAGPGFVPAPRAFAPDGITQTVLQLVETRYADHPGRLAAFDWPVTRAQAREALDDFIAERLRDFGAFQDAMWTGEPWLYHSRLSAALNLKLLSAREVIDAALAALERGDADLASVEGFVRQILGWREYVRGLYWLEMPGYREVNALAADEPLPTFFWTGETDYHCLREAIGQTLTHGYAHHIQRLMVTGLFTLLLGVDPRAVHAWYLAVYVDAVEWVELPNTLGMSQYADGGRLGSKPYVAGKYIERMSNYCAQCRYDPSLRHGARACPFTVLYWDFLDRHQARFGNHPRAGMQWRNLRHVSGEEMQAIRADATRIRHACRADA